MPRHMETVEAWSEIAAKLGEGEPVEDELAEDLGERAFSIKLSDGCRWRYFVGPDWTLRFVYHPASA